MKIFKRCLLLFVASFFALAGCEKDDHKSNSLIPENAKVKSNNGETGTRQACSNYITYGFIIPSDDVSYEGACLATAFVRRGTPRTFRVKFRSSHPSTSTGTLILKVAQSATFTYSVSAGAGGTVTLIPPAAGTADPVQYVWTQDGINESTKYLNITVSCAIGTASAESHMLLDLNAPCSQISSQDCSLDDTLYMIAAN